MRACVCFYECAKVICVSGEAAGTLLRPCRCSGTMGSVHRDCLERWLNMATSEVCELCGHSYQLHYITRPFWQVTEGTMMGKRGGK